MLDHIYFHCLLNVDFTLSALFLVRRRFLLFNSSQQGTNDIQSESLRPFVKKMAENANFSTKENDECLPNFVIFGEYELLEISDNLDDDEISLFIEENRNLHTTKKDKHWPQRYWNDDHSLNNHHAR